jgi:DNA-binding transcriptional LysR family regulator
VSAHGSIIAAAETLNVTTSAGPSVAKLELETGQRLLGAPWPRREGPTPPPRRLADAAVLSLLEEAEAESNPADAAVAGPITIAAFATAAARLSRRRSAPRSETQRRGHVSRSRTNRFRAWCRDVDVIIINDWQNATIAPPSGADQGPPL